MVCRAGMAPACKIPVENMGKDMPDMTVVLKDGIVEAEADIEVEAEIEIEVEETAGMRYEQVPEQAQV